MSFPLGKFMIHGADVRTRSEVLVIQTSFAILDLHFGSDKILQDVLAVATSVGSIVIYRACKLPETPLLEHVRSLQLFPTSILVLSLAWHTADSHKLGVTLSNGEVVLIDRLEFSKSQGNIASHAFDPDRNSPTCEVLNLHDLEAWTLAFTISGRGAFSGGDDGTLRYSSIPSSSESADLGEDSTVPVPADSWVEKKIHNAGVTAILPLSEDIVVTGSYDDHIRVVHVPIHGRKMLLAEANLGGGVWRLKKMIQHPEIWEGQAEASFTILASCMHAGTRIVKLNVSNSGVWDIEVLARFEEHKSMNYGSDIQPRKNGYGGIVISTSFYDKLLCVWHFGDSVGID